MLRAGVREIAYGAQRLARTHTHTGSLLIKQICRRVALPWPNLSSALPVVLKRRFGFQEWNNVPLAVAQRGAFQNLFFCPTK
jgi:hypothetical protein